MRNKKNKSKILVSFCFFLTMLFSLALNITAESSEVQTEGTVLFTGFYEPIGNPDPKPPTGVETEKPPYKPGENLPQTNEQLQWFLSTWGIIIILLSVSLWWNKKNLNKIINEYKEG